METARVAPGVVSKVGQRQIVLGTRKSKLARIQCQSVQDALSAISPSLHIDVEAVLVRGDADKTTPFLLMSAGDDDVASSSLPGADRDQLAKSFWTSELEKKLLAGELDVLVHSLKDLPTRLPSGTMLGAILEREDARDVLVVKKGLHYTSLRDMPEGTVVGTSSTRRKALLRLMYPHLQVDECRGNIDGRLAKLDAPDGRLGCIIVAAAGMHRIGFHDRIVTYLSATDFPYAAGQGSLALQVREDDQWVMSLVRALDDRPARWQCLAERSLLNALQGGCSSPVGVWTLLYNDEITRVSPDKGWEPSVTKTMLRLGATVVHPHGWGEVRWHTRAHIRSDDDAVKLGISVANHLLASGGGELLVQMSDLHHKGFHNHFEQKVELEMLERTMVQ